MSIATYAELKTAVANWLKRSDLTTVIPDFITLAEKRINSLSMVRPFEVETTLATVASSDLIALPSDYKDPVALWLTDISPREELGQVLPSELPYSISPVRPRFWAIDGSNIRFQAPADQIYGVKFRYEQTFALSDASPTNFILTTYPDVYLFGALLEASNYEIDDQRAAMWNQRFVTAMGQMNDQEASNNKYVPLRTEFASLQNQRFNINRGY